MINSVKFVFTCLVPLLFLHNCTSPVAGSGSQTTNGIVLTVRGDSISGIAQPGLTVELFSNDYSPFNPNGYRAQELVGSDSLFAFRGLGPDTAYNLLVLDEDSLKGVFIYDLLPGVDSAQFDARKYDFSATGQISGSLVNIPEDKEAEVFSIYIPGSPFLSYVDLEQKYSIDNIPFGKYLLKAVVIPSWKSMEDGVSIDVKIENNSTIVDIDLSQIE